MAEQPALGIAIREVRILHGMTQSDLAHECGITDNYVSIIERGQNPLSGPKLESMAAALSLSTSELNVLGTNEMPGKPGELLLRMKKLIKKSVECDIELNQS